MNEDAKRLVVLGAGMVGAAIARDLAAEPRLRVDVADVSADAAHGIEVGPGRIGARVADLSDPAAVGRLVQGYDLAVGALPSGLGFAALRAVIDARRPCVDISFMAENALALDALARERGVTAAVDCGVAPGLSNMVAGAAAARLDACERVEIYVGGLPVARHWPFDYKAGFAPADVLEEYTRPARVVEHGRVVVKEPLSEPELIDFPGVGTLEAFNTDGLRTLVDTLRAPFMKEKTLRWPGHAELMRVLKDTGFFSLEPIVVAGQTVRPRDVTAALLFPKWTFQEGEADLTVMRVRVSGLAGGQPVTHGFSLVDRFDADSGLRSMSRCTGFVAASVARLLASGRLDSPGVHPPEALGSTPGVLEQVLGDLAARGVRCEATTAPGAA
jgi:saccharopine dehydrogenase-like NADP-dependent oxidoreductase